MKIYCTEWLDICMQAGHAFDIAPGRVSALQIAKHWVSAGFPYINCEKKCLRVKDRKGRFYAFVKFSENLTIQLVLIFGVPIIVFFDLQKMVASSLGKISAGVQRVCA